MRRCDDSLPGSVSISTHAPAKSLHVKLDGLVRVAALKYRRVVAAEINRAVAGGTQLEGRSATRQTAVAKGQ